MDCCFINYGATFLIFMEYARNAVRMAALMKQQAIFVFTHDSIGLGEDGPTHQAVEQLVALRQSRICFGLNRLPRQSKTAGVRDRSRTETRSNWVKTWPRPRARSCTATSCLS